MTGGAQAAACVSAYGWVAHARRCGPGDARPVALVAPDGARLPADYRPASGPTRAAVLALHSFGDYRRAFSTFGARLARRGLATLAFDQRGFGDAGDHGRWRRDEDVYLRDVEGAVGALERVAPGAPIFVLGEGIGGAAALAAAPQLGARVAGLVLVNPAVRTTHPLRALLNFAMCGVAALAPGARVRLARRARWGHPEASVRLSRDPRVVRTLRADACAGCLRLAGRATASAAAVAQPTLIYHGARDRLVTVAAIRALAKALRGPVTLRIDEDAPHLPLQALGRDGVFAEIFTWLEAQLQPGAAAAPGRLSATCCAGLEDGPQRDGRPAGPPPLALAPPHA